MYIISVQLGPKTNVIRPFALQAECYLYTQTRVNKENVTLWPLDGDNDHSK